MTAMAAALKRVGIDPVKIEIRKMLSKWRNNGVSKATLLAEVEDAYADEMPDQGLERGADDGHFCAAEIGQPEGDAEAETHRAAEEGRSDAAPASPPEGDGAGLAASADEAGMSVPPPSPIRVVHREPSEADRRAALMVAKAAARFYYEIDGTDIHEITLGHARSIARKSGVEHYVCSVMAARYRHLPDTMTFGRITTDAELELLVRQGQEFAANGL